jgi:ABC-2 type transport system permease protein
MSTMTYTKFEALRTVRNRQNFLFSLVFPIVLYLLLAGLNKNEHNFGGDATHYTGLFAPQYYMVSLLAFGVMVGVLSGGARIAAERTIGWNRVLRLTPLSARAYLRTKVLVGYLTAIITMVLMFLAGTLYGVRLSASTWLVMIGLILVALIPFAALGIAMGHLLNDDAAGPAMGGGVSLLAFLGGAYFPIVGGGFFPQLCQVLPSWWLVQAGHVGLGGSHDPWGARGWITVAAWSIVCSLFAIWAYRRDTRRA